MAFAIRYATATDGTRLAFTAHGEGLPLLVVPPAPFSHLEAAWEVPGMRRWIERLAQSTQLALYDARSTGLSDRAQPHFGLDTLVGDIEAVAARLEWPRFALAGFFNAAPVAIAYAARHPEAVSHLVLWGGYARGTDIYPFPFTDDPAAAAQHWPMLVDTAARTWTAGGDDEARQVAAYFRACVTPEAALAAFSAAREYDVSALLPSIAAPALVLRRRETTTQRFETDRDLAAHIPGAELQMLDGAAASPYSGDIEAGIEAIERFLGVAPTAVATEALDASLTPREIEILRLVARGQANKEIASALGLSINTVERHLTNLYPKIDCRSRTEAVAYALRHGLG